MTIQDDGKSFQVERVLHGKGGKHLGLLGMRERLEMVGAFLKLNPPRAGALHPCANPMAGDGTH